MATGAFTTRFVVSADREHEVRPPTDPLIDILDYPTGTESQLDDIWVAGSTRLTFREATSPRQVQLLRAAHESFRSVRDELADRGYAPEHAAALLTLAALAMSGLVDQLSTAARWDDRRKSVRGLDRHEWTWSPEFFEVGGPYIESQLRRRFDEVIRIVATGPREPTAVSESGDMCSLHLGDAEFDLVVWDPPYYDNIDYECVAHPFTRFLRVLIGDLYPHLRWTREPAADVARRRFDHEQYDESLREASSEIARVLRPGGRLGVFWIINDKRTTADLGALLEALEPSGLELIQSVGLRTELSPPSMATISRPPHEQIFLVFRLTKGARPANAATVLDGAVSGRSVTYDGLVDLLMENLDEDEIEVLIPANHRGTIEQRLLTVVLSEPDPRNLLAELPTRSLRSFIEGRTAPGAARRLSRGELEDEAFCLLGWQVPQEPTFTIGAAIDDAERLISQLRLAQSEDEIRGAGSTAFDRIEQVTRFTVTTWATWLRRDDWQTVLEEILGRSERLTFGDWVQALAEVAGRYARDQEVIGQINRRLRRSKVIRSLQAVVALRNKFAHADAKGQSWHDLRDEAVNTLEDATKRLRTAEGNGALPEVLQPLRETRDTYGRITLRLTGHRGQVEFLMSETSDLAHPIVVLRGEASPREVDPVCLPADEITTRAGVLRT
jgi:tRNA G10  N-methylase Trm11